MPPANTAVNSDATAKANSQSSQSGTGILARYEPVIGLEVHCQLQTNTKLFCACPTEFGALPNKNTCPICLGLPGALPVLNKQAVEYALIFALGVGAKINLTSVFDRKQYFYPDLPKGYQITQLYKPYCEEGGITLASGKYIKLHHTHIEEDAGKNIHGAHNSFVDLNRAGTPLIEIVSDPVISTAEEASEYLKRLRALVRFLDIADGNLDEGSFRCDANVSIRPIGAQKLGTRCEIKNLNSFKNIERAINYEIMRQADLLDNGIAVEQNTMLFDPASGKTKTMRSKAEAMDYRYFPDPDLLPLVVCGKHVDKLRDNLPELPVQMAERFQASYNMTQFDAQVLTADKDVANYYEAVVIEAGKGFKADSGGKIIANFYMTDFLREAHDRNWDMASPIVSATDFASLMKLMGNDTISGKIAKKVFLLMADGCGNPVDIVREKGLVQVTDEAAIRALVISVLDANLDQVTEYREGKTKVLGFFVGQIMKQSGGKMNPGIVNQILNEELALRK